MRSIPTFMGVHERLPAGSTVEDLAAAHRGGAEIEQRYGVRLVRCWTDAAAGKLFCLVEAPSAEAAATVHTRAFGAPAERFYEVQENR